jgi:aminocarboxymuconate-semialdehyde decarboxylase
VYLGAYSGRIDHAWGARSDCNAELPSPPSHYLKKIFFDTVVFTPLQLETLVKTFGPNQVVMGTDYPFDMLEHDPIGHIASVASFDQSTRAALAGEMQSPCSGFDPTSFPTGNTEDDKRSDHLRFIAQRLL